MIIKDIINQLQQNKQVFENLLSSKKEEEFLWRPEPEKWNLLEIVCHLFDEEREDFKARVKHALENPFKDLTPINPQGWVKERDYISKNYNETLQAFLEERSKSVIWLKSQIHANWNSTLKHPELGDLSAKLFLTNWLAHDYLHIRQILRYGYNYLKQTTNLDLGYAGNW
ncbi:DinB family protein [Flavivirga aquimarina]|uniref:DinB family protein n=1 Tax=Flavivirga aquimarina TaxID=2027862 RepID=A0ABT8W839_9FLAO|nr:DinB family protein [Flavivirga aquimarina]MDO5969273.1 DinB family protein [Flavivirga aquimarina]